MGDQPSNIGSAGAKAVDDKWLTMVLSVMTSIQFEEGLEFSTIVLAVGSDRHVFSNVVFTGQHISRQHSREMVPQSGFYRLDGLRLALCNDHSVQRRFRTFIDWENATIRNSFSGI